MRRGAPADDVLVCADVLGAFGVTPADVRARGRPTDDLETALAEALREGRDRTAFLRQTICRADRGLDVSARYATDALERELSGAFAAIGWSLSVTDRGRRLRLEATDPTGRRRETTADYPETPLGTDNFPAIVHAIDESLLAGVDARLVICSSGRDRWRAALVEVAELERVRERYGERIAAFDRPLLPEHDAAAYVPDARPDGDAVDPWPAWALEERGGSGRSSPAGTDSTPAERAARFIEEAEPVVDEAEPVVDEPEPVVEEAEPEPVVEAAEPGRSTATADRTASGASSQESGPVASRDGFELGGWSPTVTRVRDEGDASGSSSNSGVEGDDSTGDSAAGTAGRSAPRSAGSTRNRSGPGDPSASRDRSGGDDGFGELSGSVTTTRVSNETFGADVEPESEEESYLALGAALWTGGDVSVSGLLDDDEFLPELPAVEPEETRIEFDDAFDPTAVSEARATAERDGFVWVGAGELETVRVEDG